MQPRVFGESLAFYTVYDQKTGRTADVVVYTPLEKVSQPLPTVLQGRWPITPSIKAMEVSQIEAVVGIWEAKESKYVYVLRKHPGLLALTPAECGIQEDFELDDWNEAEDGELE